MRTGIYSSVITIVLVLAMLGAAPVHAQQANPITAEVDRTSVALGETVTLTVTVRSDSISAPTPDMPVLDGFDILSTSTSSSLSLVNTRVESSSTYVFVLRPLRSGTLTIPPYGVELDHRTYQSEPIQIEVGEGTPGNAGTPAAVPPPQPGAGAGRRGEAFVQAEVDQLNPFMGEAITYIFRLYHRSPLLSRSYYTPPAFSGFWTEKESTQKEYETQVEGVFYQVTELHTVLFPTTTGDVTIDPAQLTVAGGFFEPDVQLRSEPLTLQVKSLPDGAPPGFDGAVGIYSIDAGVSSAKGKAGEPITFTLTIGGEGNLKNLPDPHWPEMDGWRIFDSKGSVDTKIGNGIVSGKRTYERLLVPQRAGNFTIPSIRYVYFDPIKAAYEIISSEPIQVTIEAGEPETPAAPAQESAAKQEVEQLTSDIRFLKPLPGRLARGSTPLVSDWLYWLAWGSSFLVLVGNLVWEWVYTHRKENAALVRSSRARQHARKALSHSLRSETGDAHTRAGEILNVYLSDKLGAPVYGLTRPALADMLQQRGIAAAVIQRVLEVLDAAEAGRFSPQAQNLGDGTALLHALSALVDDLERGFGK